MPSQKTVQVPASEVELPFDELNQDGKSTILFIHGASASRNDWNLVTPYLSDYHLLVPDLPGHGSARQTIPDFSKEVSARLISNLIRLKGKDGKAHIIGLSLGAHVTIFLASTYPEVVRDVFVSGYTIYPRFTPEKAAYGLYVDSNASNFIPKGFFRWLMDGTTVADPPPGTVKPKFKLYRDICEVLCTDVWPESWPARTLIVAAGKSGILPTSDSPEMAVKLRNVGREKNAETVAYTHPLMRHPWNRQAPELFAETVRMWIEEHAVPDGFVEL